MSKLIYLGALLSLLSICVSSQTNTLDRAISLSDSADPQTRRDALTRLARFDDQSANDRLFLALNDPDNLTREIAAGAVANHPYRDVVPALIALLRDTDKMVMYRAAESLARLGDDRAVVPLIDALERSTDRSCDYPVVALAKFHDARATMPLFKYLDHGCETTVVEAFGPEAVEPMIEIARNGNPADRSKAVFVLSYIGDERAVETLVSALNSDSAYMAIQTLAHKFGKKSIPYLRQAFNRPEREAKINVVATLVQINDDEAGDVLLEFAGDQKQPMWIRLALANTLSDLRLNRYGEKNDQIINALLVLMDDPDVNVSNKAIQGLAGENRSDVLEALVKAMSDPNRSEQASIAVGMQKDARALPFLLAVMRKSENGGSVEAQILTGFGSAAVDGLIAILTDKSPDLPRREAEYRKMDQSVFMFRCGNEPPRPNYDARVQAAWALGSIGDERARKPLATALRDRTSWLREAAANALADLDKKNSPSM